MSIFEKPRWAVYGKRQHPYSHDLSEFYYGNARLPDGVTNASEVLDYIVACLYPKYTATYATKADLPGSASPNDYAIVTDDGDGKSAGYVYTVLDGVAQWMKRYDVDWSADAIFAEFYNRTQYMYVQKYGLDDKDEDGNVITGLYAGQTVYGGYSTDTNLTFNANSTDSTGYIQFENILRPTSDNAIDIGTSALKFKDIYSNSNLIGTMTISSGSITDSSGDISFGNEDLSTTGSIDAASVSATDVLAIDSITVGDLLADYMSVAQGSISDTSGSISFGATNLVTTGTLGSGTHTVSSTTNTLTLDANSSSKGLISSSFGEITFNNNDVSGVDALTSTTAKIGNISLAVETILNTVTDHNLYLDVTGTASVEILAPLITENITATGTVGVTGIFSADNIKIDGNTISSTDTGGNIILSPDGAGIVSFAKSLVPSSDNSLYIGSTLNRAKSLYLSSSVSDGTTSITISDLLSLKDINYRDAARTQPVQSGDTIMFNGTNWLSVAQDSSIDHTLLNNLTTGDSGHTQFAMLAGRAGGQTLYGDTAASGSLTLGSTYHATKGFIFASDDVCPSVNASYSGGWTGKNIGNASYYFNNLFMKGEAFGFRAENVTSLPSPSGQNIGRLLWKSDDKVFYVDTGVAFQPISTPLTTKGDLLTYSTAITRLGVGSDNQVLVADSSQPTGLKWSSGYTSPLTTKGDIYTYSTTNARLPVGTDGQVLVADSTQDTGLKWSSAAPSDNLLAYYNAENNATTGWTEGTVTLDANGFPTAFTDGATGNFSVTSTNPLKGTYSYQLVKGSQGSAIRQRFTVPRGLLASVITVTGMQEILGTAYADGDMAVAIKVVDGVLANTFIQPSAYTIMASTLPGSFQPMEFQTTSDSTIYDLIIYQKTAASTWTGTTTALKFDNLFLGKEAVSSGSIITDPQSYIPIWSASTTNPAIGNGSIRGTWERNGSKARISVVIRSGTSTTFGSGPYTFSLPTGLVIDYSKTAYGIGDHADVYGLGEVNYGNGKFYPLKVTGDSSGTNLKLMPLDFVNYGGGQLSSSVPDSFSASTAYQDISFEAVVPIVGWSSNTIMSSDASTRVIAASYQTNSGQSFPSAVAGYQIDFSQTKVYDTCGNLYRAGVGYNSSTGAYTTTPGYVVPVSGKYRVTSGILLSSGSQTGYLVLSVTKNDVGAGILFRNDMPSAATTSRSAQGSITIDCKAGDVLNVSFVTNAGITQTLASSETYNYNYFVVEHISGPSQIAASESVNARYTASSNASLPTSAAIFDFDTKSYASHGAVTTGAAWKFTAPVQGKYLIKAIATANCSVLASFNVAIFKNGSVFSFISSSQQVAANFNNPLLIADTLSLQVGDYISVGFYTAGQAATFSGSFQSISIDRVGN